MSSNPQASHGPISSNPTRHVVPTAILELATLLEELRVPRFRSIEGDLPCLEVEWSVDVGLAEPLAARSVLDAFDEDWCSEHDLRIFARGVDGTWRLAQRRDAGRMCHALKVAVRLPGDVPRRTTTSLSRLLFDLDQRARKLRGSHIDSSSSIDRAVARSAELGLVRDALEHKNDGCIEVRIAAAPAANETIERLLDELGFETRAGNMRVLSHGGYYAGTSFMLCGAPAEDGFELWFCAPRVPKPERTLDALLALAKLAAGATGAEIFDAEGRPLDEAALRDHVRDLRALMTRARLSPGDAGMTLI